MKKTVIALLLVSILGLTACASKRNVVLHVDSDSYWDGRAAALGFADAAKEMGWETLRFDLTDSRHTSILTEEYDILDPIGAVGLEIGNTVTKLSDKYFASLQEKELPTFRITTRGQEYEPDVDVGAQMIIDGLRRNGIDSGFVGHIQAAAGVTYAYISSMKDTISEKAPEYRTEPGQLVIYFADTAQNKIASYLQSHPDTVAFFVYCGQTAFVADALQSLGREDILLFSHGLDPDALELLKEGRVEAMMVSNFYEQGYYCAKALAQTIKGEPVSPQPAYADTVLTKDSDLRAHQELAQRMGDYKAYWYAFNE